MVGTAPCAVLGAKVQTGLRPVQRCKRGRHRQVPGLGPQVPSSGARLQVRVPGEIKSPNPHLNIFPAPTLIPSFTFALLHAAPPQLHLCTASSPPPCPHVNLPASAALWPTGQLINRSTNVVPRTPSRLRRGPPSPAALLMPAHGVICKIEITGQEDPVAVLRAVPVGESAVAERNEGVAAEAHDHQRGARLGESAESVQCQRPDARPGQLVREAEQGEAPERGIGGQAEERQSPRREQHAQRADDAEDGARAQRRDL